MHLRVIYINLENGVLNTKTLISEIFIWLFVISISLLTLADNVHQLLHPNNFIFFGLQDRHRHLYL